jgi:acylphosphatase
LPRKHIVITGRVQGVGFRYHAKYLADSYRLTGWVRNLDSGAVELELQGPIKTLEAVLTRLGKDSMFIRIERMEVLDIQELRESSFTINN